MRFLGSSWGFKRESGFLLALLVITLLVACENGLVDKTAPVITNFSASESEIVLGESVTLSWEVSSDGRLTVQLNGQVYPSETSMSVTPTADTDYVLSAFNSIEEVRQQLTIQVNQPVSSGPINPEPTNPEPVESTNPEPTTPVEPTTPEPVEPIDPEPINPEPTNPEPTNPEPVNPEPTNPEPSGPAQNPVLPAVDISVDIYNIVNNATGLCADVPGSKQEAGTAVMQWECHSGLNQQWLLDKAGDAYMLTAQHSDLILGRTDLGSIEQQVPQDIKLQDVEQQHWYMAQAAEGYKIVSFDNNLCLTANRIDENFSLLECSDSPAQSFKFEQSVTDVPVAETPDANPDFKLKGKWSQKIDLALVPVAAAVLPNQRVMMWSSYDDIAFGGRNGYTKTALFDPETNQSQEMTISLGHDMFCPGISMLADGRMLVNGGSDNFATSIYNFLDNQWRRGDDMNIGRGYNTTLTLSDGNVFTLGGSFGSGSATAPEKVGEFWNQEIQEWTLRSGATTRELFNADDEQYDEHPQLFAAPNGKVFLAGPTTNLAWYDLNGQGSITPAGVRADDVHSQVGITAMYDVGKILKAGGAAYYKGEAPATAKSYTIDINNPDNISVKKLAPMAYPRAFASSVVLPDGQVMVAGGSTIAKIFDDSVAVKTPELWNPVTETWRELAPHAIARTYHSVALLMPDARVLVAGGGLCDDCAVNHPDGEMYSPPYLFNDDGSLAERPEIILVPEELSYAQNFSVETSEDIASFTVVRVSSITHSVNTDQRYIKLDSVQEDDGSYTLEAPTANIAPPGYWMLFAINAEGVPSVASMINLAAP